MEKVLHLLSFNRYTNEIHRNMINLGSIPVEDFSRELYHTELAAGGDRRIFMESFIWVWQSVDLSREESDYLIAKGQLPII